MMTVPPAVFPLTATLDAQDRLVAADEPLRLLNARAGGAIGETLAAPQLAAVPRLARRLGIPVDRRVLVADEDETLELTVHAAPDGGGGTVLYVAGWRDRTPGPPPRGAAIDHAGAWRWHADAAGRMTFASPGSGLEPMLGHPVAAAIDGVEGLMADAAEPIEGEGARIAATGERIALSATPLTDAAGRMAGWSGAADPVDRSPAGGGAADAPAAVLLRGLEAALRAPLSRIVANADSIAAEADGPVGGDYAGYAADIAHAGRHLMALVDDLADLEAVEADRVALHPEPIDLADVAGRAAGLLAVRAANASVRVEQPDAAAPALGDFRRTLQILVNLIGNALRYAPAGSAVTLSVGMAGGRRCLTVADRGKGIAPGDQARIFDKFERVDPAEPGGSGLGLYIARRLARAMGGDLSVESAPGEGARFTLSLPTG